MDGIEWQGCTAHTLQLVIGKGLVPVKKLIVRVKRLIDFFMRPKQSERLEDIQKKYPNANRLDNNENLAEGEQEEYIDARGTAKYLQLINDVATRWNSSYLAWSRLIYLKEWIKILLNTLSISTDLESKKDAKRLKQIMITDHEWDLIADLKEILSTFADATEELGGSKYITNSIRTRMLMEVIETVKPNSPNNENSVVDEREGNVFEVVEEQNLTSNDDINEPVITFGLLDEVKSRLYNNMKKYYPTLTTEPLIPSVLDPRFKSLDFTSKNQQSNTKQRLNELFVNEKEKYQREISVSDLPKRSQVKPIKRKKSLMERLAKDTTVTLDEIAEYYKLPEIPLSSDPLAWWSEKKDSFPILSRLARKYLAVSATSTASERLFSDAGNLLTNKRTRMKPQLFKRIMFLKRNAGSI
ncbi:hypothetical protein RirG_140090 [Rhizophagus irregularis DAOM 197198w]|uniref:HAT C-terminal dimerisation domain-containing protein n=2 Tax=Rhizophagus irregularis TaxID=588596 RepID=A0A015KXI6_RHIIW|nr:hypothetical protein RirG_140090 [Rhizophagus irregularis DAOM 197198w]